jgi:hypothetical protein
MKWVLVALSPGVKRLGCEADHSPPSSTEVKNALSYTSIPHMPSWRGAWLSTGYVFMAWCLVEPRYFTFTYWPEPPYMLAPLDTVVLLYLHVHILPKVCMSTSFQLF